MKKLSILLSVLIPAVMISTTISAQQWVTYNSYNTSNGLSHNTVYDIAVDGSGNKWFACYYGVSKYDGSAWTKYNTTNTSNGLAGNVVYCVTIDAAGNKWFGTDGGVSKLSGSTWTKYTTTEGLVNNEVHSIATDGSGTMWFGTAGGVSKLNGSAWTNYKNTDGLLNNLVQSIAVDGDGNVWFGCYGGVSKFNGSSFTNYYQVANGLIGYSVNSIAIKSDGTKVFATDLGVSLLNGTTWTSYTTANGLAGNDVRAIEIAGDGSIWFGTTAGVTLLKGAVSTIYTTAEGLADNFVNTVALAAGGVVWFGCDMNGVSKFNPPYLNLSTTLISVNADAASKGYIDISSNTSWTLASSETWLTSNKTAATGNYYVTLTAEENPSISPRTATVTITATGLPAQNVTVTQAASAPKILVDPGTVSLGSAQNSSAFISVNSNIAWTASSNQAWCSVTPTGATGSQSVTVIAQANNSISSRSATISFTGSGVTTQTVEVTQQGATATLSVNPSSVSMGPDAGSTTASISSTISWTAVSNQGWLTLSAGSGSGDAVLTLNSTSNSGASSRVATVTISGAGVSDKTVTVTQAGQPFINVSANSLEIEGAHNDPYAEKSIDISSNSHWEASWSDTWFLPGRISGGLFVNVNQGDGDMNLIVRAEPNPSTSPRTGFIYLRFGNSSTPVIQTITITQAAGPYISVSTESVMIAGENGSTATFNITTNTNWTVSSSSGLVSINSTSGSGDKTITLTAPLNNTGSPLTDVVTVMTATTAPLSKNINVTQETVSAVLDLSVYTQNIGYEANSTVTFNIISNIGWAISIDKNWLFSDIVSGTGNSTITLTAYENPYGPEQTATVTVVGAYGGSKTLIVTQLAPVLTLEVSVSTLNIPADDNYQTTFNITSNTDWGISSNAMWLSVDPTFSGGDKQVKITAWGNYTGESRTARLTIFSPYLGFNRFVDVTQSITTGYEETSGTKINLYPNPAHEFLNIDVDSEEITATISDLSGRKYSSEKLSGSIKRINISNLPGGVYFIEVAAGVKKDVLRFVKE